MDYNGSSFSTRAPRRRAKEAMGFYVIVAMTVLNHIASKAARC